MTVERCLATATAIYSREPRSSGWVDVGAFAVVSTRLGCTIVFVLAASGTFPSRLALAYGSGGCKGGENIVTSIRRPGRCNEKGKKILEPQFSTLFKLDDNYAKDGVNLQATSKLSYALPTLLCGVYE